MPPHRKDLDDTLGTAAWLGATSRDTTCWSSSFDGSLAVGRMGSAFLFVGPEGIGKKRFAIQLAQSLLCSQTPPESLEPCGTCAACQQVVARTHPDFDIVSLPESASALSVDLFIGDKQHRMKEGLCPWIAMKPAMGRRKIAVVDDADALTAESANCLLKTLEEPPPKSVLILIGTSAHKQLPTIRSRCQVVRFRPLADETIAQLLVREGWVPSAAEAGRIAAQSGGSLSQAQLWLEPERWQFRDGLRDALAAPPYHTLAQEVTQFVDAAGKEAPLRRTRFRWVLAEATNFFREALRTIVGVPLVGAVPSPVSRFGEHPEALAACVERCQLARMQLDANANQANLIASWLDDLAQIQAGRRSWAE